MSEIQFDKLRFLAVKGRWEREHKVLAKDMAWLLDQVARLETMSDTKAGIPPGFDDLFGGMFR